MAPCGDGWHFEPKQRWSFQNNVLSGICVFGLIELVWKRRRAIEWSAYWQRILFLLLVSVLQSALSLVESVLYGRQIELARLNERPLFVLGHPRTGTTLIHTLLALDHHAFGCCSTFCTGFPSSFLWFERFKSAFSSMISSTRPMDNMPLDFDTPQEDELATNVLTAAQVSPYAPLVFMTHEPDYRPFFSFKLAPVAARERWTRAFLYLLKKLTVRARPGVRLVLKSPVHTSRIGLLLQLFPDAQFVYMHRDPITVFSSAARMAETTYWCQYLATPTDEQILEFILSQFVTLFDDYIACRAAVPAGNLVELSYDELVANPSAAVRKVYSALSIEGFDEREMGERIAEFLARKMDNYQTNQFEPLPSALLRRVAERWRPYAVEFGYESRLDQLLAAASTEAERAP